MTYINKNIRIKPYHLVCYFLKQWRKTNFTRYYEGTKWEVYWEGGDVADAPEVQETLLSTLVWFATMTYRPNFERRWPISYPNLIIFLFTKITLSQLLCLSYFVFWNILFFHSLYIMECFVLNCSHRQERRGWDDGLSWNHWSSGVSWETRFTGAERWVLVFWWVSGMRSGQCSPT